MINIEAIKVISVQDWDYLVESTYGKPYSFQQQDGCRDRQHYSINIPGGNGDEYECAIPKDVVIDPDMEGVNFEVWKSIPTEEFDKLNDDAYDVHWGRNFYPDVQQVANDLYNKGLIPAGSYKINVDW